MDEKIDRPELGTTEAAVRACVNLIALATHTDEEHLAYWLDLYYQTRAAHERETNWSPLAILHAAEPDPVIAKLDDLAEQIKHMGCKLGVFAGNDAATVGAETPEPPAAQKKTGLR